MATSFEQWDDAGDDAEAEEEALALAMPSGRKRGQAAIYNEAALLMKLEQMTGGVDTDTDDKAWLETLAVTAPEPLGVDDAEDDIKRELAFYNQALSSVRSAQERMTRLGVPYLRPDDYFAEMLKSDQHMSKVKARLIRQQEAMVAGEQRRKQQFNKKFGKEVQREKLEARQKQKRAEGATAQKLRQKRKEHQGAPEFDIGFDGGDDAPPDLKRARTDGGRGGGGGGRGSGAGKGKGGGKGGGMSKKEFKESKFGKAHLRKDKRNDSESINDDRSFNRGPKGSGGRGKGGGKGGGRGGGKGGRGGIAKKPRPGKDARKRK